MRCRLPHTQTYLSVVANDDDVRVFRQAIGVQLLVQPLQKQVLRQRPRREKRSGSTVEGLSSETREMLNRIRSHYYGSTILPAPGL